MKSIVSPSWIVVGLVLAFVIGCKATNREQATEPARPSREAQKPAQATRIDYVNSDGFDLLFETALVNAAPAIKVQTEFSKPEWDTRLNHWIAAWNAGHQNTGLRARGQLPVTPSIVVDGDSIREFRLLVDDLMTRVEVSALAGGLWWAQKSMRDRRIALLKPYNLRFHLDANNHINLIFCHIDHAAHHEEMVRSLADPDDEESLGWFSGYRCSQSRAKVKKVSSERP